VLPTTGYKLTCCLQVTCMEPRQKTMAVNVSASPWRVHVRLLYTITVCLTLLLATAMWYGYTELTRLRNDIHEKISKKDISEFRIWHRPFEDSDPPPDRGNNNNNVYEGDEYADKSDDSPRKRRHIVEGSGLPADDFVLMNTYSRIPVSYRLAVISSAKYINLLIDIM